MSEVSKPHSEPPVMGDLTWARYMDLLDENQRLIEQLEASQVALRKIASRDSVDEWITGEECAEIARAALGELARASTQAEVEGSHPSGCRCQACLFGETGNEEAIEAVRLAASIPAKEPDA